MKKFWSEFREFAMRGSVMDMAVGVIIGGAFSSVVSSLVKDILTPLLSIVIGRVDISGLKLVIPGILGSGDITLKFGAFLENIFNFLMIALFIFLALRIVNRVHDRLKARLGTEEEEAPATPEPTKTEALLAEIRDTLKERQAAGK